MAAGGRWAIGSACLSLAAALAVLALAGRALSSAELGTSVRERVCSTSPFLGIALLVLAGVLVVAAGQLAALRHEDAVLTFDPVGSAVTSLVPVLVLLATAPGLAGCRSAVDIERWDGVGRALVGTSGIALAGAAAFGLGVALARIVTVERGYHHADEEPPPSLVDLAVEDARVLEEDPAARRFRGVDESGR